MLSVSVKWERVVLPGVVLEIGPSQTSASRTDKEIREITPFKTASNNIKNPYLTLIKQMKALNDKIFKFLKEETEEGIRNVKDLP